MITPVIHISRPWSDNNEKILEGPYLYLKSHPGKDFRPQLVQAFNSVIGCAQEDLTVISHIVEMLHNASLLIDDVEDNATLRRGFPAAHTLYGTAQTINSSNYIYFKALEEVLKLKSSNAVAIFTEELMKLHRGQGLDLYWRETLTCPEEEEYIDMVMNKTGGLYRLAVRLMQDMAHSEVDFVPLANTFGIIYQIRDDYLNLQSSKYAENKGFCEDLTEGKFSFPIIHSIRHDPKNKALINILKQRTTDVSLKEYAVKYMDETTKSFEYCLQVVQLYEQQSRQLIEDLCSKNGLQEKHLLAILEKMLGL
ncbi:farnesyltranstransferase [Nadsonia fulvescens var. elongata DSM 6958]|uniref:Farnesyltranstransferase n=1 Tax=Nadsonia fulvescens var. elongata DSM 6958 TaxID=857566 RepID=A0A1E3PDW9_9ASCO|nr:farnesyltranstransferase [Nadsonia fulvescens var. elongata DSM 6958]